MIVMITHDCSMRKWLDKEMGLSYGVPRCVYTCVSLGTRGAVWCDVDTLSRWRHWGGRFIRVDFSEYPMDIVSQGIGIPCKAASHLSCFYTHIFRSVRVCV